MIPPWKPKLRFAILSAVAVLLCLGISASVRLARADAAFARPDVASAALACRLTPDAATYWLRFASLHDLDSGANPEIADAEIAHALAANPRSAEAWSARAVRSETAGRLADAERDYLQAARVDHMYKPAWALANFYVRQQQLDKFWLYARKCLDIVEPRRLEPASYNLSPLFDLAWHVTSNPDEIRARLIPPRHFVLVDYLQYLTARNLLNPGAGVARDLLPYRDPADKEDLLDLCHRLIYVGEGSRAVQLWDGLIANGTLPHLRLDPPHSQSLTNADFHLPFERTGFDWLLQPVDGILGSHFPAEREVRLQFTGDQPEGALPLRQAVPVVPGAGYRLQFRYRTLDMEHVRGLAWQVFELPGERPVPLLGNLEVHPQWDSGEAVFHVPPAVHVILLGLGYNRLPGSTRVHGTLALQALRLTLTGPK